VPNLNVDEGFAFYLAQTRKIEEACVAKELKSRTGDFVYTIKDKGREYSRPSISFKRDVDRAIHTCGAETFPDGLETDYSVSPYWYEHIDWNKNQLKLIEDFVKNTNWDLEPFKDAVANSKGLWHKYLSMMANETLPRIDRLTAEGNALRLLNSEMDYKIEELLDNPEFKNLKSKYEFGEEPSGGGISISIDILEILKPEQLPPGVYEAIMKEREKEAAIPKEPTYESLNRHEKRFAIPMKILEIFSTKHYKCQHFSLETCNFCKEEFLPQCHIDWLYLTPPKYCDSCLQLCIRSGDGYMFFKNSTENIKQLALLGISKFLEHFGFVPSSSYSRQELIRDFQTLDVSEQDLEYALKVLSLIPSLTTVNELFGSWAHFLNLAGMLEISNRGKGGYRSIATDGHLCLSLGERAICEYLTKQGLEHSKEPMYPKNVEFNPNNLLRADFLVNDTYIEFAGRMQNADYAIRMNNKEKIAKASKMKWIKLESTSRADLERLRAFIEGESRPKGKSPRNVKKGSNA
jgi:hypothetical protein